MRFDEGDTESTGSFLSGPRIWGVDIFYTCLHDNNEDGMNRHTHTGKRQA